MFRNARRLRPLDTLILTPIYLIGFVKTGHRTPVGANLTAIDERPRSFDEHGFLTRKQLHGSALTVRGASRTTRTNLERTEPDADPYYRSWSART
jgi:hypothetical protein